MTGVNGNLWGNGVGCVLKLLAANHKSFFSETRGQNFTLYTTDFQENTDTVPHRVKISSTHAGQGSVYGVQYGIPPPS